MFVSGQQILEKKHSYCSFQLNFSKLLSNTGLHIRSYLCNYYIMEVFFSQQELW